MNGYIYLIQDIRFIENKIPIYKIGKTQDICCRKINSRFKNYPKQSKIHIILLVNNINETEKKILNIFKKKFKNIEIVGKESFMGDINLMIQEICKFIPQNNKIDTKSFDSKSINSELIDLENIFYPFYRDCNNIIFNNCMPHNTRDIYDLHGFIDMINLNGKINKPIIVNFNKIICEFKKRYDKKLRKNKNIRECDYNCYIRLTNTLVQLYPYILRYEKLRKKSSYKKDVIQIKCNPLERINPIRFIN